MEDYYKNINMLQLILKWKWHIAIVTLIGGIAGAIFSGPSFITPLYKSSAILYPANVMPYSDESETEQMLQLMQSGDIRDAVIEKYNLGNHYEIDPNYNHYLTVLHNEYNDHISSTKTQYESVNIVVKDSDPEVAYNIVNEIISLYDKKLEVMQRKKFQEVVDNYVVMLAQKDKLLDSLNLRIRALATATGMLDYASQSREVARGVMANNSSAKQQQQRMVENSGEYLMLEKLIQFESQNKALMQRDYDLASVQLNRDYTYSNIVTKPFISDKKVFPVRWFVVLLSMISALFFVIVVIGIIESTRRVNAKS